MFCTSACVKIIIVNGISITGYFKFVSTGPAVFLESFKSCFSISGNVFFVLNLLIVFHFCLFFIQEEYRMSLNVFLPNRSTLYWFSEILITSKN